jgi:hypothetical protein
MSTDIQTFGSSSINYPVAGDSVGRTSEQAVAANPDSLDELSQLETIMASIAPSPAPAQVFDDLGAACVAVFGGECIVELVEDAGEPYRLSWPRSALRIVDDGADVTAGTLRAPASAIIRDLLYGGQPTRIDGNIMAVAVIGNGPTGGEYLGAVVCTRPGGFSPAAAEILRLAVQQSVGIIRQERHHASANNVLTTKILNLELALASNRDIGVAMGVLMVSRECTPDEAFSLLRQASQDTNRKLRDIAADVVRTGVLTVEQARVEKRD